MRYLAALFLMSFPVLEVAAGQPVGIDSCRAMALRNNKQMSISEVKQDMARNIRKSARTKYLPGIHAFGSYMYTSREISLLNGDQKSALSNIGTTAANGINSALQNAGASLTPEQLAAINGQLGALGTSIEQIAGGFNEHINSAAAMLNAGGRSLVDAFRTDTRNIFAGSVIVTQPIYMGGSIKAVNRMADIGERMAAGTAEAVRQQTIYDTDKAYWTVVSLKHKKKLAESYLALINYLILVLIVRYQFRIHGQSALLTKQHARQGQSVIDLKQCHFRLIDLHVNPKSLGTGSHSLGNHLIYIAAQFFY